MIIATTMSVWSRILIKTGNLKIGNKRIGKITRLTPAFLVLLLATYVAACTVACSPVPDNSLRMGLASAPVTLDPRFATDAASSRINRLLYSRLVEFDEQQLPVPGLAHWEVITPVHYRFQLDEENRTFHDGSRLTANDVFATYTAVLDPELASPHRATLAMIQRMAVIDENTIDFYLSRPDILFPAYLVIGILPAEKKFS